MNRNCMAKPGTEEQWTFCCDVLVVLPEGASLPENAVQELKTISKEYGNIQLMAHAFDFVVTQLKEGSLFFCWVQSRGIVLYEKDNSCAKLPEPVVNLKQYENQVQQFFTGNPTYKGYNELKIFPLQKNTVKKDQAITACEQHILSPALQQKMTNFLKAHDARATNLHLREAMFEYVTSVTELGISNNFKNIIWVFEDLMHFFDLAETELRKK